jgi:hypothetical protein
LSNPTGREFIVFSYPLACIHGAGSSLREQLRFADYLAARERDQTLTFQAHIQAIGGAIEV